MMLMIMNLVSFVFVFLIRRALMLTNSPTLSHAVELSQWDSRKSLMMMIKNNLVNILWKQSTSTTLMKQSTKQLGEYSMEAIHKNPLISYLYYYCYCCWLLSLLI